MALGILHLERENLHESNSLTSRFVVRGLTARIQADAPQGRNSPPSRRGRLVLRGPMQWWVRETGLETKLTEARERAHVCRDEAPGPCEGSRPGEIVDRDSGNVVNPCMRVICCFVR